MSEIYILSLLVVVGVVVVVVVALVVVMRSSISAQPASTFVRLSLSAIQFNSTHTSQFREHTHSHSQFFFACFSLFN